MIKPQQQNIMTQADHSKHVMPLVAGVSMLTQPHLHVFLVIHNVKLVSIMVRNAPHAILDTIIRQTIAAHRFVLSKFQFWL